MWSFALLQCLWANLHGGWVIGFVWLGMFEPRLRKVLLKRLLDGTLYRGVARGAAAVVVASDRERGAVIACGVPAAKAHVRGNGFPHPDDMAADGSGDLRARLRIPAQAPLILYVGRIARGKGIDHLLEAARQIPDAHVVLAGPDDRHGVRHLGYCARRIDRLFRRLSHGHRRCAGGIFS